jgi:ADP-heptose:LPS heptosyltransferase
LNTSFVINGGAGRVIAAVPALEKFHRLNPQDDFKVFVYGWESLYWSHPVLQKRTFSIGQKGVFDTFIRDSNLIVPEPYDRRSYYTQQKSLAEVFDEEINKTDDHSDLTKPNLYLQSTEIRAVQAHLQKLKCEKQKNKVIVFQPYGSGIGMQNNRPFDGSIRSLDVDDYLSVAKKLSEHAIVVFFGPKDYIHPADDFTFKPSEDLNPDLRFWMACISQCDYFVGCDSVGQHMARAFDKPGTVIMGSTFEKNVSYPGYFEFFRNGVQPTYAPIRIGGIDCEFADRANDQCMMFSESQLNQLTDSILAKINVSVQKEQRWSW